MHELDECASKDTLMRVTQCDRFDTVFHKLPTVWSVDVRALILKRHVINVNYGEVKVFWYNTCSERTRQEANVMQCK